MLIDSHCHVLSTEYENVDDVINDTFKNGVEKIIINGYDINSSIEAINLSKKYKNVYAAIGIGPESVDNITNKDILFFDSLVKNDKVVAIGEIGLDFYWTTDNKSQQLFVFENMLKLANKYNLPVIVHSRKSIQTTYNLLKDYNVNGIMHCYSGSYEMAKECIKLGFLIGIGGVVTFKNAKEIKNIVKQIDLENISLETDSPYLSPEPLRGKTNYPKNLVFIANEISKIKNVSINEVINKTSNAVISKFDLK